MRNTTVFWALLLLLPTGCSSPGPAFPQTAQIVGWNFDWDDNVMYLPTPIILERKSSKGDKVITTEEFTEAKHELGKTPAYRDYAVNPDDKIGTFRYFRDVEGQNFFFEDIKKALKHKSWKGPSWDAFAMALKDPGSRQWTTVITARGHSRKAMQEGVQLLVDRQQLPATMIEENIYPVSNRELLKDLRGNPASPSEAKPVVMKEILDRIQKIPLQPSAMAVLDQDGKLLKPLHLWGFSDDDYDNYEAAIKMLSPDVKAGRWNNIKITLFYTGRRKPNTPKQTMIINSRGVLRQQAKDESQEAEQILKQRLKNSSL